MCRWVNNGFTRYVLFGTTHLLPTGMWAPMPMRHRVETYLDPEVIERIEAETENRAAWIRQAVEERLENDGADA